MSDPYWKSDRLLKLILFWISIIFLTGWLPMIRGAFDGPSYEWGTEYFGYRFGGKGTSGDYWLPVLRSFLGIAVLFFGWRGYWRSFTFLAMPVLLFNIYDSLYSSFLDPDAYLFRGDTLGVEISLAWVAPVLSVIFLVLTGRWLGKQSRLEARPVSPWSRSNTVWIACLAALLPIQFFLLHHGTPQSLHDKIGVVLTILQWLLLGPALALRK